MFWEIFSRLCAEQNIKPNPLAKKIGIPSASITNWKNGRMPHETTLIKIADYFGVTVAYLKGETEEQKKPPAYIGEELSEGQRKLIEFARSVPEDKIDLVLKVMQSIVEAD
jgi:transcriptional regulator with XRE-family HTH domain